MYLSGSGRGVCCSQPLVAFHARNLQYAGNILPVLVLLNRWCSWKSSGRFCQSFCRAAIYLFGVSIRNPWRDLVVVLQTVGSTASGEWEKFVYLLGICFHSATTIGSIKQRHRRACNQCGFGGIEWMEIPHCSSHSCGQHWLRHCYILRLGLLLLSDEMTSVWPFM
jgi:hypothetical protein